MLPTIGTKTSMWFNTAGAFLTVFAGTDWVGLIGKPGAYLAGGAMAANALLHAVTGNSPIVKS